MRSFIRRSPRGAVRNDEGSGLILVFLVMLISSALSLVLLEGAVSMAGQTASNNRRVTSLSAAQAGLDATLGQIRDATTAGSGDVSEIPCTVAPGQVGGTNSPSQGTTTGSYSVLVTYFATDPSAQSAAWRSNSANYINCPVGGHPDKVPGYAWIQSKGVSSATTPQPRIVVTTYIFTTTNKNISGGIIPAYNDGTAAYVNLCPDAGSAHPAVGTVVTMQPCSTTAASQQWAYQSDLSFLLVSTTNDASPAGPMCMEAAGTPSAPKLTQLKMALCTGQPTSGTATIQQQFSFDNSAHLRNTVVGNPDLGNYCWTETQVNTIGSPLELLDGCNGYTTANTWAPIAAVGAGMASAATQQLVNYQEFGRCLDQTDVDPTKRYMIIFPCKQDPNPSNILWNEKWAFNGSTAVGSGTGTPGTITTNDTGNGVTYCLTSPMATQTSPTVPGPFVVINPCPAAAATPSSMKWVEIGNTGNYATSYVIHDSSNPALCLGVGLTGGPTPGLNEGAWDSAYVQTCDGSLEQKWNAPPNVPVGTVTDTNETNPNGS